MADDVPISAIPDPVQTFGWTETEERIATRHDPVRVRWYRPHVPATLAAAAAREPAPTLIWLHGGAFSAGGLDWPESAGVARRLADRGIEVVAVAQPLVSALTFPLARLPLQLPGRRHPVPVQSLQDVVTAVSARRGEVVLGGASAGACASAGAAFALQGLGHSPAKLLLAYGSFHPGLPPPDAELRDRIRGRYSLGQYQPFMIDLMNRNYVGHRTGLSDPTALPGGQLRTALPPMLLLDAERDRLRASSMSLAAEQRALGGIARQVVIPEARHGFLNRPTDPGFNGAIEIMISWLRP